jgi:hypothetical protein
MTEEFDLLFLGSPAEAKAAIDAPAAHGMEDDEMFPDAAMSVANI